MLFKSRYPTLERH